jgi:hypothetical protein
MRQDIFVVLLLTSCAFAIWKGGAPERIAAATLFVGAQISLAAVHFHHRQFINEEYGLLTTDALILLVLGAIAFRSTRWWPLFLAGLQLDGVLVHLIHFAAPQAIPIAYLDATALWSYPMVLILAGGTWRHVSRLRERGEDQPWKASRFPPRPLLTTEQG